MAAEGETDLALRKYDEAVAMDADNVSLRVKRAELRLNSVRHADALADLNTAIQLDPRSAKAYRLRATVKERLDDLPGSEADNLKATELEKGSPK